MKRWLSILAVFGCIVALSGCKNENEKSRVVFNGDVMESDPLQIGTVYAIYLLDENGEVIPNN